MRSGISSKPVVVGDGTTFTEIANKLRQRTNGHSAWLQSAGSGSMKASAEPSRSRQDHAPGIKRDLMASARVEITRKQPHADAAAVELILDNVFTDALATHTVKGNVRYDIVPQLHEAIEALGNGDRRPMRELLAKDSRAYDELHKLEVTDLTRRRDDEPRGGACDWLTSPCVDAASAADARIRAFARGMSDGAYGVANALAASPPARLARGALQRAGEGISYGAARVAGGIGALPGFEHYVAPHLRAAREEWSKGVAADAGRAAEDNLAVGKAASYVKEWASYPHRHEQHCLSASAGFCTLHADSLEPGRPPVPGARMNMPIEEFTSMLRTLLGTMSDINYEKKYGGLLEIIAAREDCAAVAFNFGRELLTRQPDIRAQRVAAAHLLMRVPVHIAAAMADFLPHEMKALVDGAAFMLSQHALIDATDLKTGESDDGELIQSYRGTGVGKWVSAIVGNEEERIRRIAYDTVATGLTDAGERAVEKFLRTPAGGELGEQVTLMLAVYAEKCARLVILDSMPEGHAPQNQNELACELVDDVIPPGPLRFPNLLALLFERDAAPPGAEDIDEKDAPELPQPGPDASGDEPQEAGQDAPQDAPREAGESLRERTLHPRRAKDPYRMRPKPAQAGGAGETEEPAAPGPMVAARGKRPPGIVRSRETGRLKNVSGHHMKPLDKSISKKVRNLCRPHGRSWAAWQARRNEMERRDKSLGWKAPQPAKD